MPRHAIQSELLFLVSIYLSIYKQKCKLVWQNAILSVKRSRFHPIHTVFFWDINLKLVTSKWMFCFTFVIIKSSISFTADEFFYRPSDSKQEFSKPKTSVLRNAFVSLRKNKHVSLQQAMMYQLQSYAKLRTKQRALTPTETLLFICPISFSPGTSRLMILCRLVALGA